MNSMYLETLGGNLRMIQSQLVNAGIEGTLVTVGMALTAGQIALIMPEAAMYIGAKSNNVSLFSWGATQNGILPQTLNPKVAPESNYNKVEFQGRNIYQRNDIDWDYVDPETGLTNLQRTQKGWAPYGVDGMKKKSTPFITKGTRANG